MILPRLVFGITLFMLDFGNSHSLRELTCNSFHSNTQQTRGIRVEHINYTDDNPGKDTIKLQLDPCSHRTVGKLQISWSLDDRLDQSALASYALGAPNNRNLSLCVSIIHVNDGFQKEEMCYALSAEEVRMDTSLFCLLNMTLGGRMIVNVYVTFKTETTDLHFHGEIDTSLYDLTARCRYVCDVLPVIPVSTFMCHVPVNVTLNNATEIASITIRDSNGTEHNVAFNVVADGVVEITMTNTTEGRVELKLITYHPMSGVLCSYVKDIDVICGLKYVTVPVVTSPEGEEFTVYLQFAAIASVIIIAIIITTALFVYHIPSFRRWLQMRRRRGSGIEAAQPFRRESIPLHLRHSGRLNNAKAAQQPTLHEIVTNLNGFIPSANSRSSMLANSILFAPMLYDHYTKQCMSRLQDVLTLNGLFSSDCLFDIISNEGEPGQIYQLIDSLTGDRSKIVVFLCFRNPGRNECKRTISDDLLENFRPPKLRPKCNVIIVVVTDIDKRHTIRDTYYGEVFHLMQEDEYRALLSTVLKIFGLNVDTMDEVLTKIVNSKESVDFLDVIGAPYGRDSRQ